MIYIRADANPDIGMGHIMRCLSIADAARSLGESVIFILADDTVRNMVEGRGYEAVVLKSDYRNMESEIKAWPLAGADIIIVDSYYVTADYLAALRRKAKLIYIDDVAAFPYPSDIIVNYNIYGLDVDYKNLYAGTDVSMPRFLLGPSFAPLRVMFRSISGRIQRERVKDILISTGGSDPEHIALRLVEKIHRKTTEFTYHILMGRMNEDGEAIRKLAGDGIMLHENVSDMKSLICSCDIAVSAAGSTLYEICACGVPFITYILADNQIPGADAFEKYGLAECLGDLRDVDSPAEIIISSIDMLSNNYQKRVEAGERMQKMIDGFGADRIVQEIM